MDMPIPIPLIPTVDLSVGVQAQSGSLTREQVAYLGCISFKVTDDQVEKLLKFLVSHVDVGAFVDATALTSPDDVVALLDAGSRKVFVTSSQLQQLKDYGDRVLETVTNANSIPNIKTRGVFISAGVDLSAVKSQLESKKFSVIFASLEADTSLQQNLDIARTFAVPLVPAASLTADASDSEKLVSVPAYFASVWKSDRTDGLLPTIVTDENGYSLGLVYSSKESVSECLKTGTGVYQSRKRGLWYKGATSGDTQQLVQIAFDCDLDSLKISVKQKGRFCHLPQASCFGEYQGIAKLQQTLESRKVSAPEGSYTARLFSDEKLLRAKIMEEAEELCNAKTKAEVAFEAADLIYFAMTKAVSSGVSWADIERSLDAKSFKVKRRQGDAKGKWAEKEGITNGTPKPQESKPVPAPAPADDKIRMQRIDVSKTSPEEVQKVLQRPSQKSSDVILGIIKPIIKDIQARGDAALLEYTHKFEKATSLKSPVLKAPYPEELMKLSPETTKAIDISFENIRKFHSAQKEEKPLQVETMPGVVCSRFSRAIERVGLYIPGGTAVLPSTALMLGVPAMVAGCKKIVFASPPRSDGSITPEIVYVAHKVGAESIVLAGGAQAVAALAYGTESVSKVDKILGPGNQFVTAAKMHVSNDTNAGVGIDMPAGPSEVLVIADKHANPTFVASDLLSQAEHGVDSQVILIAIDLTDGELQAIEDELHAQAMALPRVEIVKGAIAHSVTLRVETLDEALKLSNDYAPEHLILQLQDAEKAVALVENAGSVFIGQWTPESVGDYSAGVNHSLPTYGFAKQYSGVNLGSYLKHITSSQLTAEGLRNVGGAVMELARVEELEAHRRAVSLRIDYMDKNKISR